MTPNAVHLRVVGIRTAKTFASMKIPALPMQSAKLETIKHDANAQQALKAMLEAFAKEVSLAHNFLNQF